MLLRWRKTNSNLWFRISKKRFFYAASKPKTARGPHPVLTTDNRRFTVVTALARVRLPGAAPLDLVATGSQRAAESNLPE